MCHARWHIPLRLYCRYQWQAVARVAVITVKACYAKPYTKVHFATIGLHSVAICVQYALFLAKCFCF